jgi:hypothetical protein
LTIVYAYREAEDIDPVESFRQGWKEVQEGKTLPIEGLWSGSDSTDAAGSLADF